MLSRILTNYQLKKVLHRIVVRSISTTKMTEKLSKSPIVWVDLEMTGLEIDKHHILEVGILITDENLNVIAEGPNLIVHQPEPVLNNANDWVKENMKDLLEQSSKSQISENKADQLLLEFLKEHIPGKNAPLAGNSVYMDRIFIRKYFPRFDDYLHYRIIDVSTVKELAKRWNTKVYYGAPKKKLMHRALDDIKESLEELKYYKLNLFNLNHDKKNDQE